VKCGTDLRAEGGQISVEGTVAALTDGVVKAMFMTKIRSVLAVVLVVGLALGGIGAGFGLLTNPVAVARTKPPKQPTTKGESPTSPVATKKDDKTPHIVEKRDKKAKVDTFAIFLPIKVVGKPTEDLLLKASMLFISRMPPSTHDDIRFRDIFDPRYLKEHGLTDRDIAFEFADNQGRDNIGVADDLRTVLCITQLKGGGKEAIILRWVIYEGHLYISPEKAPDPKTGIFKPWILRTKVN
jgi:hypothetical protein